LDKRLAFGDVAVDLGGADVAMVELDGMHRVLVGLLSKKESIE